MDKMVTGVIVFAIIIFSICDAFAGGFSIVGPRALGMGGAFVAVANDSTAVYWNPAGLAKSGRWDIRIPVSLRAQDHVGVADTVADTLDEIDDILAGRDITDPTVYLNSSTVNSIKNLLTELAEPGTGIDVDASAGLLIQGRLGGHNFAISGLDIGYASSYPEIDLVRTEAVVSTNPNSFANNQSKLLFKGIEAREYGFSYARALMEESLFVGATAKLIDGNTYYNNITLFNSSDVDFEETLKKSKREDQAFSADIGIIYVPVSYLSLGLVGRDVMGPDFQSASGQDAELEPQVRFGIALQPFETLTVALDADITENDTFTPGYSERDIALGMEKTFFAEWVAIRVGGYKNVAESDSNLVGTAGIGLRLILINLDIGAGYDFQKEEALGSLSLAARF